MRYRPPRGDACLVAVSLACALLLNIGCREAGDAAGRRGTNEIPLVAKVMAIPTPDPADIESMCLSDEEIIEEAKRFCIAIYGEEPDDIRMGRVETPDDLAAGADASSPRAPDVIFTTGAGIDRGNPEQYRGVYRIDLAEMHVKHIFKTDFDWIGALADSPDKTMVAVLVTRLRFTDGAPEVHNKITVIDSTGGVNREFANAAEGLAWSPDGKTLAYTTGVHVESQGFRSTGTFLHDMATGQSTKVYEKGLYLYWAVFDGRLYIRNNYDFVGYEEVDFAVYDPLRGSVSESPHKSISFSPDGRFYWVGQCEEDSVRLMRREDDADVTGRYGFLKNELCRPPARWLSDGILAFQSPRGDFSYLLDLGTGRTLEIPGHVLALRGDCAFIAEPRMAVRKTSLEQARVIVESQDRIENEGSTQRVE